MPAAGARRTTRVFMPKAAKLLSKDLADPGTRVLRSGKRLFAGDRIRSDAKDAAAAVHAEDHDPQQQQQQQQQQQHGKDSSKPELPPDGKSLGKVYTRKHRRRKLPVSEVLADEETKRFGVVYTRRKGKRPKVSSPSREPESDDLAGAVPCSSSREFASRTGFLDAHFLDLVDYAATNAGAVALVVLVDTSCSGSSKRFLRFLLPVLPWMRRSCHRGKFRGFAAFVSSDGVTGAFALHGLHFFKLQRRRSSALLHTALVHCGLCVLHGAKKYEPLLSVNFSALPSYFQRLHSMVALESMYLPTVVRQSRLLVGVSKEICPPLDVDPGSQSIGIANLTPHLDNKEPCRAVHDYLPLEQIAGVAVHGFRLNKHNRKRRSMRRPRNRMHIMARLPGNGVEVKQSLDLIPTEAKLPSARQDSPVEPVQPKPALEISLDLLENLDEGDVSTPMGSTRKQKRSSLRSPIERMNEKQALAEVRQNIDSTHCKANILNFQADRCWREEGAEIMLEVSDANEWYIVVKIQSVTRHSLKPSDARLNGINRYTHAYMWGVDDTWKLEFIDKWDWLLFREFHNVGRGRNSLGKTIPIPGVCDVSDYMVGTLTAPYSRPVQDYIRMVDDQVVRALSMDSLYDMDSEDELWLSEFNCTDFDNNSSEQKHISYEDFEKIITTFEKDAYTNPDRTNDVDQFLSRNPSLGNNSSVRAVYGYWRNRVSKRGAPLIRIFEVFSRGKLSQKSSMKRKRSLKKQRNHGGRGKPVALLQDTAEEAAAMLRVKQAERAAKQTIEKAIRLRSRAQSLMVYADLAAYKSVMALRIAEAARRSDSSRDLVSTILD